MIERVPAGAVLVLLLAGTCPAQPTDSAGNVDGALTWTLGAIEPGSEARAVVLFAFDSSYAKLRQRVDRARRSFAKLPGVPALPAEASPRRPVVWLDNKVTDFALEPAGGFNWERHRRQCLRGPRGGQLSQFAWAVHYRPGAGRAPVRHAGPTVTGRATGEWPRVVRPVHRLPRGGALGESETPDGVLGIRIRAVIGAGSEAAIEFVLTNRGPRKLGDVRLSTYANLEANHDHENDYAALDRGLGGWVALDPQTGVCAAMTGLTPPDSGVSATYRNSEPWMRKGQGAPLAKWPAFEPPTGRELARLRKRVGRRGLPHAVAPEIADPVTPETRTLSPDEARALLEKDWLFQADNDPTPRRVADEVRWARELARRLARHARPPDLRRELADLDRLAGRLAGLKGSRASGASKALYLAVRRVKRRIVLANPRVDFTEVLFIDNPYPQGGEWPHQARHRNGTMAVPGGRLLVLDGLHPGGRIRKLAPDRPASFWRPDLSFDARKVLFCMKPHDGPAFHLYEIGLDPSTKLGAGGAGLRQLTDGPYDDLDPIYLPDGHIMFCTGRAHTYVRCMPYTQSYVLARCDGDGRNIYIVSCGNEPDWLPALLDDGRVIYSRWEYTDKALWRIQSLWTTNPDGTGVAAFWGNQSVWPDHLAEPRPIPGTRRIMFTGLGHHNWFAGCIGIIDPDKGFNFPDGLAKVTADLPWPESGNGPVDPVLTPRYHRSGRYDAYKTPYPLGEEDFLVSARSGGRFRLYLMDVHGNRELIYEGAHHVWHAMPVRPRQRPPALADRVAWPGTGKDRRPAQPGLFYSASVFEGVGDLPREKVRYLRVIRMDSKTYSTWNKTYRHSGPGISIIQEDGVKRILGTVPVHADGSVCFRAPPGKALHFQLLDGRFRCLHTMRSFTGVLPGEKRGCLGCHELMSAASPSRRGKALDGEPAELTPPPWGIESVSYERFCQPVLDRHCGRCHQGDGKGRKKLDLTLRPGHAFFKEPYLTLVGPAWTSPIRDRRRPGVGIAGCFNVEGFGQKDPKSYATVRPMTTLSIRSRLIEIASGGRHHGVKVAGEDLRRLIAWVDTYCPYRGDREVREVPDPVIAGLESLPVPPKVRSAPVIERP